jgi:hypothetical protein
MAEAAAISVDGWVVIVAIVLAVAYSLWSITIGQFRWRRMKRERQARGEET